MHSFTQIFRNFAARMKFAIIAAGEGQRLKEEGVEVVYIPRTPEISSSQITKDLYDANAVDGETKTSHDEIDTDPDR